MTTTTLDPAKIVERAQSDAINDNSTIGHWCEINHILSRVRWHILNPGWARRPFTMPESSVPETVFDVACASAIRPQRLSLLEEIDESLDRIRQGL